MFYSDANANIKQKNDIIFDFDLITLDIIPFIEKDIDPCDIISIVFLLYDVPDTALQRLTVHQRISKDLNNDSNLLLEWALHAQAQPNWKKQLLEALYTCQLYSVIRKIGIPVDVVKRYYVTNNETWLDPMKKILYRLCEHMRVDNLLKLKKTLITYDIDSTEYETCELVFLYLMCQKFISLNIKYSKADIHVENLAKIIDNFSELQEFAKEMRKYQYDFNSVSKPTQKTNQIKASVSQSLSTDEKTFEESEDECFREFKDIFEMLDNLKLEDIPDEKFESDTITLGKDAYQIINPKAVGICLIINQEKFHPSKKSIGEKGHATPLDNRYGSTKDKINLTETMTDLNFEVITYDNLNHIDMLDCIKSTLKFKVCQEHSMFMLCILSHGTRGNVYAADSVKIKVEDIESLLDSEDVIHLRNKPKIMILQACQTNDDQPSYSPLVADSPKLSFKYYIKKSDIVIYWATAPSYEAFRHVTKGSIFIQMLCAAIKKYAKKEHLNDLFTKVNCAVRKICVSLKRDQLPKVEHTLIKKLYLQIPEK